MIERAVDGDVHVVTMRNGQNTFDLHLLRELNEAFDAVEAASADGPGALVLTGEGKFFSNGLDLAFLTNADDATRREFGIGMLETIRRLLLFPVPTVAAVNGHAFAAGAFLAFACDFRVQREDRGWICVSEVDAGVPIGKPMMRLLTHKMPAATAREAVLTGRRYDGPAAVAAGLADRTVSERDLMIAAKDLVRPVAAKERGIFKALKASLYADIAEKFQATRTS